MGKKKNKDSKVPGSAVLYGELYLDANGKAHWVVHTKDTDFRATEIAIEKFIALLQDQIDRKEECPFNPDHKFDSVQEQYFEHKRSTENNLYGRNRRD